MSLTPRQQQCLLRLGARGDVAMNDDRAVAHRGRWRERLGMAADARLVVEIGCAAGALLARVAAGHPTIAFVGIDWKFGDVLRAADRVTAADLQNVTILRGRAQSLRQFFASDEIDELWMFHPEPVGPRLFDEPFLLDAARVLRPGGSISLKTDHAGYYQSTLAMLGVPQPDWPRDVPRARLRDLTPYVPARSDVIYGAFDVALTSHDFWNDPAAQTHVATCAFAGERTPYEQRFVDKRRPIFYVELRRRQRSAGTVAT